MAELMTEAMNQAVKAIANREGKYLTFSMGREEYGIGILKVKEIIGMMPVTSVPQTPGFVKGVINLRGKVIPVMNLRLKFGMEEIPQTDRTCIIVVETRKIRGAGLVGIVVDSVSEVLNIKSGEIEEPPVLGAELKADYILGMAKINGGVKILLDIDTILSAQKTSVTGKAASW